MPKTLRFMLLSLFVSGLALQASASTVGQFITDTIHQATAPTTTSEAIFNRVKREFDAAKKLSGFDALPVNVQRGIVAGAVFDVFLLCCGAPAGKVAKGTIGAIALAGAAYQCFMIDHKKKLAARKVNASGSNNQPVTGDWDEAIRDAKECKDCRAKKAPSA